MKFNTRFLMVFLLTTIFMILLIGCLVEPTQVSPPAEEEIDEEPEVEEVEIDENDEVGEPDQPPATIISDYYWPWISHAQLSLSSGEVILGPDLFVSDIGFIAEFTEEYAYTGRLIWFVEESDVFDLDWVNLAFDVEYYEQNEWLSDIYFEFNIEDLMLESGEEGIREVIVNQSDEQQGFKVIINTIIFGKQQESAVTGGLSDYIALDVEMIVIGNP
ncbi:MAG: hypothetical protein SCJ97_03605 [Bacillota bacterium]|nr:hypothetical protein [Bacillota bacterium]